MRQRILLIQHDPAGASVVQEALAAPGDGRFAVERVKTCAAGLACLRGEDRLGQASRGRLAAVLVDLFLPDSQGVGTFDQLFDAAPEVPILVLCDSEQEDIGRLAVQHGAQDYLLEARIDGYLLPKALGSMVDRAVYAEALFDERERAQVTLNSIGDAVLSTDIRGRVTYLNVVAERLTGWSQEEAQGHPLEDVFRIIDATTRALVQSPLAVAIREDRIVRLLRAVAQRLLGCVRASDTVSRQGGDEFVILLPEVTDAEDAAVSAAKILLALSAPHRIDRHDLHLTASIGVVTYPDDGTDADALLRNADFAMYHAKECGRNGYPPVRTPPTASRRIQAPGSGSRSGAFLSRGNAGALIAAIR